MTKYTMTIFNLKNTHTHNENHPFEIEETFGKILKLTMIHVVQK